MPPNTTFSQGQIEQIKNALASVLNSRNRRNKTAPRRYKSEYYFIPKGNVNLTALARSKKRRNHNLLGISYTLEPIQTFFGDKRIKFTVNSKYSFKKNAPFSRKVGLFLGKEHKNILRPWFLNRYPFNANLGEINYAQTILK